MLVSVSVTNYSWPDPIHHRLSSLASVLDGTAVDTLWVPDHLVQADPASAVDEPMLEAYTALGALATATQKVQLGTLVTGNTYRNPTLLAKAITTLDVISQGRAILGIGTGWFELEHEQLGYEFGTFTDRFNKLGEALQIILPMLAGERPTFSGKYYRTVEAMANPRFRDHIPLMIGGSGEKKTIPLAARHFDHLNIIANFDELPRKLDVIRQECERIDRDPATLETSMLVVALIGEQFTADAIPPDFQSRAVFGSAEQIAEQLKTKLFDTGVNGVILSPVTIGGYVPGGITAAAEALKPLISG